MLTGCLWWVATRLSCLWWVPTRLSWLAGLRVACRRHALRGLAIGLRRTSTIRLGLAVGGGGLLAVRLGCTCNGTWQGWRMWMLVVAGTGWSTLAAQCGCNTAGAEECTTIACRAAASAVALPSPWPTMHGWQSRKKNRCAAHASTHSQPWAVATPGAPGCPG